jgi:hypothetical protein
MVGFIAYLAITRVDVKGRTVARHPSIAPVLDVELD